jgi:hypothetical protein
MRCGLLFFRARGVWRFAGGALAGQELRGLIGEEQLNTIDQQPEALLWMGVAVVAPAGDEELAFALEVLGDSATQVS